MQEKVDRAEHMGIAIPADVKEQIFEYANLIGEEEKVRTLVRNLADAINQADEDKVEELLDYADEDFGAFQEPMSVIDQDDALINDRPYKRKYEPEEAIQMISNGECGAFSNQLMQCFQEAAKLVKKAKLK